MFFFILFTKCSDKGDSIEGIDPIIKDYPIICNTDSLEYIYNNFDRNIYIPIKIVVDKDTINGRMRIRGDSSRKDHKKSLKVKYTLNGKRITLNFNAEYSDKSYIRQYLSSKIMKAANQKCFNSQFTNIYINGIFFGLYLLVENMDADFLASNSMPENGDLFKATKDGACMSLFDNIETDWEKKIGDDKSFDALKSLISNINLIHDSLFLNFIKSKFNYPDFINMLALNIYLANGSTYYHNYYLYRYPNGKWELLPWDMDKTLSYYDWMPYQYHRTSSEWESDNPLIERAILNPKILTDIKKRINKLSLGVCDNNIISLINKIEPIIRESVLNDKSDQINNINDWLLFLDTERLFFTERYETLQTQFATWPSSFATENITNNICNEILFKWSSSNSPRDKKITYTVFISPDFLFNDTTLLIKKETTDTCLLYNEVLPNGVYYWKVQATDGEFYIDGFNSKNIFKKVSCSILPININQNTILKKSNTPYLVNNNLFVKKNVSLTIEQGVEIRVDSGVNILVHGNLNVLGTKMEPVIFRPKLTKNEWGHFYFFNGFINFDYTHIIEGILNAKNASVNINNSIINIKKKQLVHGWNRNPIIWTYNGSLLLKNSVIDGNKTGEGINTNFSKSIVINSDFIDLPDAIEYICVDTGLVENCLIKNSPDDAIDMNACHNIIIRNNTLINNSDKGISVGKEQYGHSSNILIENNTLINNKEGVSVKDSSFAIIRKNKFYKNWKGISLFRKDSSSTGGYAEIYNNVFYDNSSAINIDKFSKAEIGTNISDTPLNYGNTQIDINIADSVKY